MKVLTPVTSRTALGGEERRDAESEPKCSANDHSRKRKVRGPDIIRDRVKSRPDDPSSADTHQGGSIPEQHSQESQNRVDPPHTSGAGVFPMLRFGRISRGKFPGQPDD